MRKNSIKNIKVNSRVRQELGEIIRAQLKDPRVAAMTSVTSVTVAADLKTCKAYISVLGDEKDLDDTVRVLKRAEGFIRRELARRVNMRNTPEIEFVADRSIAYGVSMSKKIDEVIKGQSDGEQRDS